MFFHSKGGCNATHLCLNLPLNEKASLKNVLFRAVRVAPRVVSTAGCCFVTDAVTAACWPAAYLQRACYSVLPAQLLAVTATI